MENLRRKKLRNKKKRLKNWWIKASNLEDAEVNEKKRWRISKVIIKETKRNNGDEKNYFKHERRNVNSLYW